MSSTQNTYKRLYGKSPGQHYLTITGSRLPTYLQVLLCYESNKQKLVFEKIGTNNRSSSTFDATKIVYEEVKVHYEKSGITLKGLRAFKYDLDKLIEDHKSLVKGNQGKGIDIQGTMKLWPKDTEKKMKKKLEDPFITQEDKNNIEADLQYLESMKTDRVASYSSSDRASISRTKKRKQKIRKEIVEPTSSSVMTSQETFDIPLTEFCDSDSDVPSLTEHSDKRSHKRNIKTGVHLFLPKDFVLDERLVRTAKRINIRPAELSTILSVLIDIGGGNIDSVNLSYAYIQRHYNEITKEISSSIRENWTAPKNLMVHWDDKTDQTLDGTSKEKRLAVAVSGKGEKLLGAPPIGKKLTHIYGKTVCKKVMDLLKKWNCVNSVNGMVWFLTQQVAIQGDSLVLV